MDLRTGKRMQLQFGSPTGSQRLSRGPASEPKRTLLIAGITGLIVFLIVGFGNPVLTMATLIGLWIFGAILGIWALVSAFRDTLIQGILVMFVPCYVLFFIFFRSDSPALRRWASIHLLAIFALVAGIGLRIVQGGNVSSVN
jgi:hypothetical protein